MERCWLKSPLAVGECPSINPEEERELLYNVAKRLRIKCIECPKLLIDLASCETPHKVAIKLLPYTVLEQGEIKGLQQRLAQKERRLKALTEVTTLLRDSTDLEEILYTILTYLTASDGFGYNRAFILLVDEHKQCLVGSYGIGSRTPEEALEIWSCLQEEACSITNLLKRNEILSKDKERLGPILDKLQFSMDTREPLARLLFDKKVRVLEKDACPELQGVMEMLSVDRLAVLPLWSGEHLLGVILLDNLVTKEPFHPADIKALEAFSAQAAIALERASLYQQLKEKIQELEKASKEAGFQQESLAKLEKMAAVGTLTSKVAHEIRNPVTAIGGLANYLLKKGKPDKRILENIVLEALKLEELIQDLVAFADSICPSKARLDLSTVVEKAIDEVKKVSPASQYTFSLVMPKKPMVVEVDPRHIRALIWNLVKNAMEAMPEGGEIGVVLKRDGEQGLLEVSDEGGGIPEDLRKEVLKPFFGTKGGTGMGLPICVNVARGYGGSLQISSNGRGTSVIVSFPLEKIEEAEDEGRRGEKNSERDGNKAWEDEKSGTYSQDSEG